MDYTLPDNTRFAIEYFRQLDGLRSPWLAGAPNVEPGLWARHCRNCAPLQARYMLAVPTVQPQRKAA